MGLLLYRSFQPLPTKLEITKIPYMKNGHRDYKTENKKYNSRPDQVKAREERNKAHRIAEAFAGHRIHQDVDHKTPLSKGGDPSAKSNLRVTSAAQNRSFSRNADGSLKSQTSKRESRRK